MITISTFTIQFALNPDQFIRGFNGRIAHGAFLQYLRKHDILLSADLHAGNQMRPFVLDPIRFTRNDDLREGILQVHTFDERINKALISMVIDNKFGEIYIVDQNCAVTKIEFRKKVVRQPQILEKGTRIQLNFGPTYFANDKRKSKSDAYPHLRKIWNSIITTYRLFDDDMNDIDRDTMIEKLINQLATPYFSLNSTMISMSKHMKIICFKGKISFVVEDPKGLELLMPMLDLISVWGIGGKRAMGFGRIRFSVRVPSEKLEKDDKKKVLRLLTNEGEGENEVLSSN